MGTYRVLNQQIITDGEYSLVPIRYEDRWRIMQWRNEQIYHLRQAKPLTEEQQEYYFTNVIANLFDKEQPDQILFSYLKNGECIGYGGLVHINWTDKNAEISFIINTVLEKEEFDFHWRKYLTLLEQIAFNDLAFHKIYTYAFNLRPHLYNAIEKAGFVYEATLKEDCLFEGKYIDSIIHSKINQTRLRSINKDDLGITYEWAKNKNIRRFFIDSNPIPYETHKGWFEKKLFDEKCIYLIFENTLNIPMGSVRVDIEEGEGEISYLLDEKFQGRGLGKILLRQLEDYLIANDEKINTLIGKVLKGNISSITVFRGLNYREFEKEDYFLFKKILRE